MKLNIPAKRPMTTSPALAQKLPDQLMSLKQAAAYMGVSVMTLRRWIKAGLPHMRAGRQIRIDKAELVAFISQN